MRGESMKGKSKKSTYSTTFGVDPKNQPIPQPLVLTQKKTAPFGSGQKWWPDQESNQGHQDFQSSALPTELSGQKLKLLLHFK